MASAVCTKKAQTAWARSEWAVFAKRPVRTRGSNGGHQTFQLSGKKKNTPPNPPRAYVPGPQKHFDIEAYRVELKADTGERKTMGLE